MDIEQKILDTFLDVYADKYLLNAKEAYPLFEGNFLIKQSIYLKDGLCSGHLNAIDALFCYNQLAYVSIANAIKYSTITKFSDISFEYFEKNMLHCFMYKVKDVIFRKPIDTTQKFYGCIKINNIKKIKNTVFLDTNYDFEYGKATANIGLAMVL